MRVTNSCSDGTQQAHVYSDTNHIAPVYTSAQEYIIHSWSASFKAQNTALDALS